jgi:hypothetical protein
VKFARTGAAWAHVLMLGYAAWHCTQDGIVVGNVGCARRTSDGANPSTVVGVAGVASADAARLSSAAETANMVTPGEVWAGEG